MRTFFLKTVNLLLVCGILAIYQQYAVTRAAEIAAYEKEVKLAQDFSEEEAKSIYKDGVYQGSGMGFGGEILIQITISEGEIIAAEILSAENETPEYLKEAEKILTDVVSRQTGEVDTVSGATLSSNGILEGVRAALSQA